MLGGGRRRPAPRRRAAPALSASRNPRPRRDTPWNCLGLASKRQSHRGDAVAWRPETARYRARAGARSKSAAAGRADRRHGHRRALAHDRQGAGALGEAEDHGRLHRARHGYRVQDRAGDRRALLRPHSGVRHAGRDPPESGRDRRLSRHRASRRPRYERAAGGSGRGPRRLLRHQPDPVRRRPLGAAGRDHGAARAATAPASPPP